MEGEEIKLAELGQGVNGHVLANACSEETIVDDLESRMHGEDTSAHDPQYLISDPPTQMIVAPESIRARLVAADDDPFERDGNEWEHDPGDEPCADDGDQQGSHALPVGVQGYWCEERKTVDDSSPCEGNLQGI